MPIYKDRCSKDSIIGSKRAMWQLSVVKGHVAMPVFKTLVYSSAFILFC